MRGTAAHGRINVLTSVVVTTNVLVMAPPKLTHHPYGPRVPPDSLEQEVFLNLWRTYDCLKALEETMFARFDLSAQQYNALRLLKAVYPESLPTLALSTLLISRAPDITRLLDKLELRQLLCRRRRPENRRVVDISLTPEGLALLSELEVPVRECHQCQVGHLDPQSQQQLMALLKAARQPHEDAARLSLVDA